MKDLNIRLLKRCIATILSVAIIFSSLNWYVVGAVEHDLSKNNGERIEIFSDLASASEVESSFYLASSSEALELKKGISTSLHTEVFYKVNEDEKHRPKSISWLYQISSLDSSILDLNLNFNTFVAQGLGEFDISDIEENDLDTLSSSVSIDDKLYTAHIVARDKNRYTYLVTTPILEDNNNYTINVSADVKFGNEIYNFNRFYTASLGYILDSSSKVIDGNMLVSSRYCKCEDKKKIDWDVYLLADYEESKSLNLNIDDSHNLYGDLEISLYKKDNKEYKRYTYENYEFSNNILNLNSLEVGNLIHISLKTELIDENKIHSLLGLDLKPQNNKRIVDWEVVNDLPFIRENILNNDSKKDYYSDGYGSELENEDIKFDDKKPVEDALGEIVIYADDYNSRIEDITTEVSRDIHIDSHSMARDVFGNTLKNTNEISLDDKKEIIKDIGITSEELESLNDRNPEDRLYLRYTYEDGSVSEAINYTTLSRSLDVEIDKTTLARENKWVFRSNNVGDLEYETITTEWLPWEKILFPEFNFSFDLGSYSEEAKVESSGISIDPVTKQPVIEWTFTTKTTGGNATVPSILNRYFSTSADSGLGTPEIVSIKKYRSNPDIETGQDVKIDSNISSQTTAVDGSRLSSTREIASKSPGVYVYKIKTPVLAPRDNYALDVNTYAESTLPIGSRVSINGETRVLKAPETIRLNSATKISLPDRAFDTLSKYTEKSPNTLTTSADNRTIAGDYDPNNENKINWYATQTNTTSSRQSYVFDMTPDSSQNFEGMTLYYYKREGNGYVLDPTRTRTFNTPTASIDDVEPGDMVQAVAKTTVVDNKVEHSIKGAKLDSLYGDLKIEKTWAASTVPKPLVFTLDGGEYSLEELNLPVGQTSIIKENIKKFNLVTKQENGQAIKSYERIDYEVLEKEHTDFVLLNYGNDIENLKYSFTNIDKRLVSGNSGTAIDTGKCSDYGVISLNNLDMNQIYYKDNRYTWSGALTGRFRIPPNAKGGDKFVLKLDDEKQRIDITQPVSTRAWFPIRATNRADGYRGVIGWVFLTARNELTFELVDEARYSSAYEGDFTIGNPINMDWVARVNGAKKTSSTPQQYWGIVPNSAKLKSDGWADGNVLRNTLDYSSTYYGFNGDYSGSCTRNGHFSSVTHFTDNDVKAMYQHVNKYVIEEDEESVTYEIVFNATGHNYGAMVRQIWFVDRLSETIELYGGNNANNFRNSIEIYRARPDSLTGTYDPNSLVKVYPGANYEDQNLKGSKKQGNSINIVRNYGPNKEGIRFNYEIWFNVANKGSDAFVMRLKARKLREVAGHIYNEAEIWIGSDWQFHRGDNRYRPTEGVASAEFGKLFDFSIQKTGLGGDPNRAITNNRAKFRIWAIKDNAYVYSKGAETDDNGIARFEGIPTGEYTLEEKEAPQGFLPDARSKKIRINNDGTVVFILDGVSQNYPKNPVINVVNTPILGLRIKKVDSLTNNLLKGAVFKLYSNDANKTYEQTIGLDTNGINQDISEFTFKGLNNELKYILTELQSPVGYRKALDRYFAYVKENNEYVIKEYTNNTFTTLMQNQPTKDGDVFVTDFINERENKVEFKKLDFYGTEIPSEELAQARFELWMEDKANGTNKTLANGDVVKLRKVGNTERVLDVQAKFSYINLLDGVYYVYETVAPSGYMLPKYPVAEFGIKNGGLITTKELPIIIKNTKKGRFIIKKVDERDQVLEGVEFTLYTDEALTNRVSGITNPRLSDSEGKIIFDSLEMGTYYLKETATISGYKLKDDVYRIRVEKNGQTSYSLLTSGSTRSAGSTFRSIGSSFFRLANAQENISIKVKKIWQNTENKETVRVRLKAKVGTNPITIKELKGLPNSSEESLTDVNLAEDNSWQFTYTNLPRYHNGIEVVYEIEELSVDNDINFANNYDVSYLYSNNEISVVNRKVPIIKVINERNNYDIKIIKIDKLGNEINSYVRFAIEDENGKVIGSNDAGQGGQQAGFNGSFIYNNSGRHFPNGTYYIREIEAPNGYTSLGFRVPLIIEAGNIRVDLQEPQASYVSVNVNTTTDIPSIELSIKNDKLYSLRLRKRDAKEVNDNNADTLNKIDALSKKLEARFELADENGNSFTPKKEGVTSLGDNKILEFTSIKAGIYTLKEIEAPIGYVRPEINYKIRVEDNGDVSIIDGIEDILKFKEANSSVVDLVIKNIKKTLELEILKIDKDEFENLSINETTRNIDDLLNNLTKLNGARFELLKREGDKLLSKEIVTISNGKALFRNLNEGTYVLRELNAPTGYLTREGEYTFELTENGEIRPADNNENWDSYIHTVNARISKAYIIVLNQKSVKIKLRKVDTSGNLISGTRETSARFLISKLDTNEPENNIYEGQSANLLTGELLFNVRRNGVIKGFDTGQYYLYETRAPEGYIRIFDKIPFYIKDDGTLIIPSKLDDTGKPIVDTSHSAYSYIRVEKDDTNTTVYNVHLINKRVSYPSTGGMGSMSYLLSGILLIIYALYALLSKRKLKIRY